MKEVENRFELIRIAVGLTDHEVIDLQVRHLRNFSTDARLHAILQELERKNFRQALFMMQEYLSEPEDDFFGTPPSETAPRTPEKRVEEPEKEKGLFDLDSAAHEAPQERILGLDDMLKMTKESATAPRKYAAEPTPMPEKVEASEEIRSEVSDIAEDDPLFSLDKEPVSQAPIVPDSLASSEPLVNASEAQKGSTETPPPEDESIREELFAFGEDEVEDDEPIERKTVEPVIGEALSLDEDEEVDYLNQETEAESRPAPIEEMKPEEDEVAPATEKSTVRPPETDLFGFDAEEREGVPHYAAFAYMGQKYRNMLHQYPQVETSESGISEEVQYFIDRISTHDYSESQVEAAIARYQQLRDEGRLAEAAQILIAAATTESTFAQFMLARELFKGEVLQQDYPEAFTQINHLAEEDYPEAICDLGQLYEYGIGIDKNKRHALLLYEEAAEMGVERARRHYERLSSSNPVKALGALFRRH